MLARCARMRPCLARFWRSSSARRTVILSASVLMLIPVGTALVSSPFGPLTLIEPGFWARVTPLGSGRILRPIRLMGSAPYQASLPNFAEKLTAQAFFTRGPVGHQPLRRRQDRDAQARTHLGDRPVSNVHPLPRPRAAAQPRDRVRARVGPAQANDDLRHAGGVVTHVPGGDVALVLQEDAQPLFQLGGRREHFRLARQDGVANASEKIRDWVSHGLACTYNQLD